MSSFQTGIYRHNRQLNGVTGFWIWFTFTVAVCRSIDVSLRILPSPVPATRCPFANNNFLKVNYFGNANSGYFYWIMFLRAYIGWSEQSTAVAYQGFKVFVYSIQSFNRWCCVSVMLHDRKFSTQMTSSFWWLQQGIEDFSFLLKQRCSTFKCNRFFESRVLFSLLLFKIVPQWYWKVFKCLLWIVSSYARMELRKYFCIS